MAGGRWRACCTAAWRKRSAIRWWAWSLFAAVMIGTHVPAFYDLTLRAPVVHAGEHALYLWAALIFWAPLIAVDPVPHRSNT